MQKDRLHNLFKGFFPLQCCRQKLDALGRNSVRAKWGCQAADGRPSTLRQNHGPEMNSNVAILYMGDSNCSLTIVMCIECDRSVSGSQQLKSTVGHTIADKIIPQAGITNNKCNIDQLGSVFLVKEIQIYLLVDAGKFASVYVTILL